MIDISKILLDKNSKSLLKQLINLSDEKGNVPNLFNINKPDVKDISVRKSLRFLQEQGLINVNRCSDEFDNPSGIFVNLSYQGLHYFDFKREEIKAFILKSILVPCVTAIITAAFTPVLVNIIIPQINNLLSSK